MIRVAIIVFMFIGMSSCTQCSAVRVDIPHPPAAPTAPGVPAAPKPPAATATAPAVDPLAALQIERDDLKGKLASVESKLTTAQTAITLAPLLALCKWASWVGTALALAGVAWAVMIGVVGRFVPAIAVITRFIPLGWQAGLAFAAAGAALATVALTIGIVLPWVMKWAVGGFAALVIGGLLWLIAAKHDALRKLWDKTQDEAAADPVLSGTLKLAGIKLPVKP
jgi:hypothetical protein